MHVLCAIDSIIICYINLEPRNFVLSQSVRRSENEIVCYLFNICHAFYPFVAVKQRTEFKITGLGISVWSCKTSSVVRR